MINGLKVEPANVPGPNVLMQSHTSIPITTKHSDGGGEQGDFAHVSLCIPGRMQASLIRSIGVQPPSQHIHPPKARRIAVNVAKLRKLFRESGQWR